MKKALFIVCTIFFLSLFLQGFEEDGNSVDREAIKDLIDYSPWYNELVDSSGLSKAALYHAYERFSALIASDSTINDSLLSIIDFSKPSNENRFYLIDIKNQELLYASLVAHGLNSGALYAQKFSNRPSSHMSSLGMYVTANTYTGRQGYSLRLNGLDKGVNDNAYERAVVIHGANYVSQKYADQVGRIGRSFGCPALPQDLNAQVINLIKEGSSLYIYHPSISETN